MAALLTEALQALSYLNALCFSYLWAFQIQIQTELLLEVMSRSASFLFHGNLLISLAQQLQLYMVVLHCSRYFFLFPDDSSIEGDTSQALHLERVSPYSYESCLP